jgi:IS30 family transposase
MGFSALPAALRRSITFDNGTEFALHHELTDQLDMQTFFCDPHSPWQKGGVENAIGRIRRPLPRKSGLAAIDQSPACAAMTRALTEPTRAGIVEVQRIFDGALQR